MHADPAEARLQGGVILRLQIIRHRFAAVQIIAAAEGLPGEIIVRMGKSQASRSTRSRSTAMASPLPDDTSASYCAGGMPSA